MRCWSSANVRGLFYSCDDKVPVSKVHVPFRIIQSFVFCSAVSTNFQWAYAKYGRLFSSSSLIINLLLRCWSSLKVRGFFFSNQDEVPVSKLHVPSEIIQSFLLCNAVCANSQWAYATLNLFGKPGLLCFSFRPSCLVTISFIKTAIFSAGEAKVFGSLRRVF